MNLVLALAPLVGAVLAIAGLVAAPFFFPRLIAQAKAITAAEALGIIKQAELAAEAMLREARSVGSAVAGLRKEMLERFAAVDLAAVRAEIAKLSSELQSAIGGVQSSLAALDLPGVKQSVAALRIATGSAVADLHTAIAESRAQPLSADAKALQEKIEALHDEVKDQKQASLVTDAARAHAIVLEAVEAQKAHEQEHKVEYQGDQREHSVFLKAQRAYQTHRLPVPANLSELVADALRD